MYFNASKLFFGSVISMAFTSMVNAAVVPGTDPQLDLLLSDNQSSLMITIDPDATPTSIVGGRAFYSSDSFFIEYADLNIGGSPLFARGNAELSIGNDLSNGRDSINLFLDTTDHNYSGVTDVTVELVLSLQGNALDTNSVFALNGSTINDALSGAFSRFVALSLDGAESGLDVSSAFNGISASPVPVPAAAWFFGSAILGLAGIRKVKA